MEAKKEIGGTENSEAVESETKEKDVVDRTPMDSGAAEPEAGPDVELLKSTMKNYCFIQDACSATSKTGVSLRPFLFLVKK